MSSLSQFNAAVHEFVADLKNMPIEKSDLIKLQTYVEVTRVNSRTIISNFQKYALRDTFVQNIVRNNVEFFITYDPSSEVGDSKSAISLIGRIQSLVRTMLSKGDNENIEKTLRWIKILIYHAYIDIGIDAGAKLKSLM
jgi:hypothetical protein